MKVSSASLAGLLALGASAAFAQQDIWPEGKGKDVVSAVCVGCHEARRFTAGNGYTPDGWQTVLDMMKNIGAEIPPDRLADVKDYLVANWPEIVWATADSMHDIPCYAPDELIAAVRSFTESS